VINLYFTSLSGYFYFLFLLITVIFTFSITFLLNQLVIDKETKMRESLKIMSASRLTYSLSFFLAQSIFSVIVALIFSIPQVMTMPDPLRMSGSPLSMILGTIMLGFALNAQAMAISTIFTDSKLAP
jgi:energy-converting hydrogenase Eha subunit A